MPIRIKCPQCQTVLGVKETLAGKKANCPKCRYMLTIPSLAAAPLPKAEDAEALALSAFAEEPVKAAPAVVKFVEFECPFCAEMVKIDAEHAGKQAPCPNPECKRIVKVPLLKADKPKDWRQMDKRGPSGALRMDKDEPEGTWSTAQKMRVSQEALLEANAIPVRKQPMKTATKVRLGIMAAVAFCLVTGGAIAGLMWTNNNRLMGPFNAALAAVGPEAKLPTAGVAEIHRGIGEFYLMRGDNDKAKEHFQSAYSVFPMPDKKPDAERDAVLIALMVTLIGAGADSEGGNKLGWATVKQEIGRALQRISCDDAKQSALREVATRLIAAKQDEIALRLATELSPPPPPQPQQAAQDPADPGEDGPKAAPKPKTPQPPTPGLSVLAAQQIAILYVMGQKDKATAIADAENCDHDLVARLGWAQAKARKGEYAEARKIAKAGDSDLQHFEASLAIALIAGADKKTAEAKASTEDALKSLARLKAAQPKHKSHVVSVWLMIELAQACAQSDMPKEAKETIDALGEGEAEGEGDAAKAARAVAQLGWLQMQLDAKNSQEVAPKLAEEVVTQKNTVGYFAALDRVARHNTRLGKRSESLAVMDSMDERSQPFVQLGVALGMMDTRK